MRCRTFFGIVTVAILLAACGSTSQSAHAPDSTNTTRPSSSNEPQTATPPADTPSNLPTVSDPINPDHWEQTPCNVLTQKQLDRLSIETSPESREGSTGPECEWGDLFDDKISIDGSCSAKVDGS